MKLSNESIIKIYGYDQKADYIYGKLNKSKTIIAEGRIRQTNKQISIEVEKIEIIK